MHIKEWDSDWSSFGRIITTSPALPKEASFKTNFGIFKSDSCIIFSLMLIILDLFLFPLEASKVTVFLSATLLATLDKKSKSFWACCSVTLTSFFSRRSANCLAYGITMFPILSWMACLGLTVFFWEVVPIISSSSASKKTAHRQSLYLAALDHKLVQTSSLTILDSISLWHRKTYPPSCFVRLFRALTVTPLTSATLILMFVPSIFSSTSLSTFLSYQHRGSHASTISPLTSMLNSGPIFSQ